MNIYSNIVRQFPRGIVYSFAYGSGVKQQLGYEDIGKQKSNVIDLTFCVDNAAEWHADNLKKHPSHYSSLKFLGSRFIASYQNNLGAGVYFNTLVPLPHLEVTIKYGVVTRQHLERDLNDWTHLYLAGRLHKPVTDVIPPTEHSLGDALQRNLQSALVAALLMLPERFGAFELFHTISNISYKGDFRMIFGENKSKVKNIVDAQLDGFFKLYHPEIQRFPDCVTVDLNTKHFEQDKSTKTKTEFLKVLPSNLKKSICANSGFEGSYEEGVEKIAESKQLADLISKSIDNIVWWSSISQSVKNIPTAGVAKSIVYSYRKALKTFS